MQPQSPAPIFTHAPTPEAVTVPELPEASPIPTPEADESTAKPAVTNPKLPNNSSGLGTDAANNTASVPISTLPAQAEDSATPVFDFGLSSATRVGNQVMVNPSSRNMIQASRIVSKAGLLVFQPAEPTREP